MEFISNRCRKIDKLAWLLFVILIKVEYFVVVVDVAAVDLRAK